MLSFFFPKHCVFCSKPGSYLCPACQSKLVIIKNERCPLCGVPYVKSTVHHLCVNCQKKIPYYDWHQALFVFDKNSKKIIYDLKYHHQFWITRFLKKHVSNIWQQIKTQHPDINIDYIIPVPLHPSKLITRGYNQSLLLASVWKKTINKPVHTKLLLRHKTGISQTGLSKTNRKTNIAHSFTINPRINLKNKNFLLLDDVHTTGATLNEASKTLKNAGAKHVYATSIAMAL